MKLTWILAALCIIGFVYGVSHPENFAMFGFSTNNLIERPYVLITSIFLHGSLDHLLSNLVVLIFFGLAVENELGKKRTLLIFLLGAFAGDLLSALFYAPNEIAIGASAGIFALIGAGLLLPIDIPFHSMAPIPLAVLGIAYAVYNVYGFVVNAEPDVSYIAHFGGLFVGLAFGLAEKRGLGKNRKGQLL